MSLLCDKATEIHAVDSATRKWIIGQDMSTYRHPTCALPASFEFMDVVCQAPAAPWIHIADYKVPSPDIKDACEELAIRHSVRDGL